MESELVTLSELVKDEKWMKVIMKKMLKGRVEG